MTVRGLDHLWWGRLLNQARIRNNPLAIVPTASTATTIQSAVDMEQLSAYGQLFGPIRTTELLPNLNATADS